MGWAGCGTPAGSAASDRGRLSEVEQMPSLQLMDTDVGSRVVAQPGQGSAVEVLRDMPSSPSIVLGFVEILAIGTISEQQRELALCDAAARLGADAVVVTQEGMRRYLTRGEHQSLDGVYNIVNRGDFRRAQVFKGLALKFTPEHVASNNAISNDGDNYYYQNRNSGQIRFAGATDTGVPREQARYVRSPFSPDMPLVNVTGIPAGSQVTCPYTGRNFILR